MDDRAAAAPEGKQVALIAAVVAALLGVVAAKAASYGAPTMPTVLGFGGAALAFAGTALFAWQARDEALSGATAIGIASSTRWAVVALLFFGIGAPILMLLMRNPFLIVPTAVVINVASAVGGVGILLTLVAFLLQFPLAAAGRRLAIDGGDRILAGKLLGFALGGAPVALAIVVASSIETRRVDAAVQHSHDENAAFLAAYTADSLRAVRRGATVPRAVLTRLNACVHTGCVDSLLLAAKADSVIVNYRPLPRHRYWASAQVGRGANARRLVTDQTGGFFHWPVRPAPDDHAAPDSTDILIIADTTALELSELGDCVWYQYQLDMKPVPPHVTQVCALSGDTTTIRVSSGTEYAVEFLYIPPTPKNRRGDFALSARPSVYGRGDVRSFLIRDQGKDVRATTEDRAARANDPAVDSFEFRTNPVRIETH